MLDSYYNLERSHVISHDGYNIFRTVNTRKSCLNKQTTKMRDSGTLTVQCHPKSTVIDLTKLGRITALTWEKPGSVGNCGAR